MGKSRAEFTKAAKRAKSKFHALRKSGSGYKIIAKSTGKPLSKKPMSRADALSQLRAVEYFKHGGK
jgi:hypothetical protein